MRLVLSLKLVRLLASMCVDKMDVSVNWALTDRLRWQKRVAVLQRNLFYSRSSTLSKGVYVAGQWPKARYVRFGWTVPVKMHNASRLYVTSIHPFRLLAEM
jgi:hypothetical protein